MPATPPRHVSVAYRRKALPLAWVRGTFERQQRRLLAAFLERARPEPSARVLDLGVNGALERREAYFFEHGYPWPERVVACGLEEPERFRGCFPRIPYVRAERGRPLPFGDAEFDWVFCNAVIEHVGDRASQVAFLAEILRVGRAAFVTTPNRWYPVELHTLLPLAHWLPVRAHRGLLRALGFDFFAREENLNLLDRRALLALVPPDRDAELHAHRFLGGVSNWLLVVPAHKEPGDA